MWIYDVLHLFYPQHCLLCKRLLTGAEQQICLFCHCDLPHTNYHKKKENPLFKLFDGIPQIHEIGAYLFFEKEGYTQRLIHAFKYDGNKNLAKHLGQMAARDLKTADVFHSIDYILPVPLHFKKKRKRGYNQSECIAEGFESVYQRPIKKDILFRSQNSATQTRKTAYDRHVNVEQIFTLKEPYEVYAGKHLLLIDDVITTGATLKACIDTLILIPDIRISIFSLATVQFI